MSEETDAAARYRQRAEEVRVIARSKQSKETRQILLGIAADYETLAESMIAIDVTNQRLRKPRNSN